MPAQPEIVAWHENVPLNLQRNNAVSNPLKSKFADSEHWAWLTERYLSRYNLPGWDVPCDPESMSRWLDRLNISEREYQKRTSTTLEEFIHKNPAWPLRAFIGTVLEMGPA